MSQPLNRLLIPAPSRGTLGTRAEADTAPPVLRGLRPGSLRPGSLCAALVTAWCLHATASAQTAEVLHWWTSKGESAAVHELAAGFERAGGKWVDSAVAGGDNARNTLINRILGGKPPTVAQFSMNRQFNEIADEGVLVDMNVIAAKQGWDKVLPEAVQRVVKVKGRYLGVPLGIHNPSWIWTSKAVLAKAGVMAEPQSMTEFFAALDKVRAAGATPLALGGQSWQEFTLFYTVLHASGGRDLYARFFSSKDGAVATTPEMKKVLSDFKRLKGYVDSGSPNRDWNLATAMIITDKAGFQVMGDWAKGEFNSAGKVAGKDYGCFLPFGPKASYVLEGDLFIFPRSKNPKVLEVQQLFASVVMSPAVQAAFAAKKGAVPVRSDVDMSAADACAQRGSAALKDPTRLLNTPEQLLDPDRAAQLGDVVTKFWNTNQSVDDAAKALGAALRY